MAQEESLADLAKTIERETNEPPRNANERLLRLGANFIFAIAFFALGLTANIVASAISDTDGGGASAALIFTLIGIIFLSLWNVARQYESVLDEGKARLRDANLVAMIADEVEKRLASQTARSPAS